MSDPIRAAIRKAAELGRQQAMNALFSAVGAGLSERLLANYGASVTKSHDGGSAHDPDLEADPHDALLLAQIDHIVHCHGAGSDHKPGHRRLQSLWDSPVNLSHVLAPHAADDGPMVQKFWEPGYTKGAERSPKGGITLSNAEGVGTFYPGGQWIPAAVVASATPAQKQELAERNQGARPNPPNARERASAARQQREGDRATSRKRVAEMASDIMLHPGARTPDKYRDLADAVGKAYAAGHLTVADLRALRLKLSASFGGGRRKEQMVAALVNHARGAAVDAADLPDPEPGNLFQTGGERDLSSSVRAVQDVAAKARRAMPDLFIPIVPATAPLSEHLHALGAIDRHVRDLGVRTNFFRTAADRFDEVMYDHKDGDHDHEDMLGLAADARNMGLVDDENPQHIADELREKGHPDAAEFFEKSASKVETRAIADAIEAVAGPAPKPEDDKTPKTVEELEARMREVFEDPTAFPNPRDAFDAALDGVDSDVRRAFYQKHELKAEDPQKNYYKTRNANALAALKKFGPGASGEPEPERYSSDSKLRELADAAIPRADLMKTHRNMKKYSDLREHGYTISHWLNPSDPKDQILEYNPWGAAGKQGDKPRLTARSGEDIDAIHDALGIPRAGNRPIEPSRYDPVAGVVRGKNEIKNLVKQGAPADINPSHVSAYQSALKRIGESGRSVGGVRMKQDVVFAVAKELGVSEAEAEERLKAAADTPEITPGSPAESLSPNEPTAAPKKPWEMTREELEASDPATHEKIMDRFPSYGAGFDASYAMYLREAMERGVKVPLAIRKRYLADDFQKLNRTGERPVQHHELTRSEFVENARKTNESTNQGRKVKVDFDPAQAAENHRSLVESAIRNGKEVPPEVLAEHNGSSVSTAADPAIVSKHLAAMSRRGRATEGNLTVQVVPHPGGGYAVETLRSNGDGTASRDMLPESYPDIEPAQRAAAEHLAASAAGTSSPNEPAFDPESAIKISADSVGELRKPDVFRVLDWAPADKRAAVADHITRNRPDLKAEVNDVMGELGGATPATSSPNEPTAPASVSGKSALPHVALAQTIGERLKAGALGKNELWQHADTHFGGTRAEGKYGPSDAYDAMESGFNRSIEGHTDPTAPLEDAQRQARELKTLVDQLPTQTNRSGTKEAFQQFSTPPHYAFAANWLANLKPGENVLEPSAGTGDLAVHAKNAGANVTVNELDPRRADFLRDQFGHGNTHLENAEQIAGILPKKGVAQPSAVVMNPPFSQTAGRLGDKKELMTGAKHIAEAGRMLAPNGRLVAIVGRGMTPDSPTYRDWFRQMEHDGMRLRANVGVSGDEYKKLGTSFGTRVLVFDKAGPTKPLGMKEMATLAASLRPGVIAREGWSVNEMPTGKLELVIRDPARGNTVIRELAPTDANGVRAALVSMEEEMARRGGETAGRMRAEGIKSPGDYAVASIPMIPGAEPVTGDAADIPDLMAKLEGVRNDRPEVAAGAAAQPAGGAVAGATEGAAGPGLGAGAATGAGVPEAAPAEGAPVAGVPDGAAGAGGVAGGGGSAVGDVPAAEPVRGVRARGKRAAERGAAAEPVGAAPGGDADGAPAGADGAAGGEGAGGKPVLKHAPGVPGLRPAERVPVESAPLPSEGGAQPAVQQSGGEDSQYANYQPARLRIPGSKPHNTRLVESAAMAAVAPPVPTYQPTLSPDVYEHAEKVVKNPDGTLSKKQIGLSQAALESVVYAGQAHQQFIQGPEADRPASYNIYIDKNGKQWQAGNVGGGDFSLRSDDDGTVQNFGSAEEMAQHLASNGFRHSNGKEFSGGGDEYRRGYFIGDGTGAGKGRQIAGIILDNANQGRSKHVWITEKKKLFADAKRDWADMGQDHNDVVNWDKFAKNGYKADKGILFTTYDTLKSGPENKDDPRNVDRLIEWLGKDFDGVIAFDEAHNMGNANDTPGPRGTIKASQRALAAMKLQKALPKARVVYVSATGATKPENLAYADRLGLWGRGTAFPSKAEFLNQMEEGGTAAMESVAQSTKARGLYGARSLSYDGVQTDRLQHKLTDEQRYIYDNLAEAWQAVHANIDAAIKSLVGGDEKDARKAGRQAAAAKSQFQSAQQRFFNQVITSMMTPTLIKNMEKDIAEGRAPVVQLVNTMESATKRALSSKDEDQDYEELDISPKQMLIDFLDKSFPVHRLHEVSDENGNTRMEVVKDADGNPVEDPAAVAMRDELKARTEDLRIPESPLDMVINHFGHENVAEATGRTQRLVRKPDKDGVVRLQLEKRSAQHANQSETDAFQGGKKKVMIFSQAGGTGASYHADKNAKNQAQRSHYLLQPGWRADTAVQGLGRTHRTNQASAPIFHLMEAPEIPGQKRFVSTIARRLSQLGALTKGQADTGSGVDLFTANDNLESKESQEGLESFINELKRGVAVGGMGYAELMSKLGFKVDTDAGGSGWRVKGQSEVPEMRQFLNRVLALKLDDQRAVFDALDEHIQSKIEQAKSAGTYDTGVEKFPAKSIARVGPERTVYRDPASGAESRLITTKTTVDNPRRAWEENLKGTKPLKFVRNSRSGNVWAVYKAAPRTTDKGDIVGMYVLRGPGGQSHVPESQVDSTSYWKSGYEDLEQPEAERLWKEQHGKLPATVENTEHFVTGDLLSVWDKLPKDKPKIYRVKLDDGSTIVGRHVSDGMIKDTLSKLGVAHEEGQQNTSPAGVHAAVLNDNATGVLSNGWKLKRARVGNENRVELEGPIGMHKKQLVDDGVIHEKVGFKDRYFIPTGANGPAVLDKVLRARNANMTELRKYQSHAEAEIKGPPRS